MIKKNVRCVFLLSVFVLIFFLSWDKIKVEFLFLTATSAGKCLLAKVYVPLQPGVSFPCTIGHLLNTLATSQQ